MVTRLLPIITVLTLLVAGKAAAVDLGELTLASSSGQPLSASVRLLDVQGLGADDIRISVASAEDFERFSVPRDAALNDLQFSLELDASGGPLLRLSTPVSINEPFLSLVLDTRWPSGRVLTEYTLRLESPSVYCR